MADTCEYALKYRNEYHFSVIPVGKDKKPLIKWEEYQKRIATEEEIRAWWEKWPDANVGIVTGTVSNLAVIDIDTDEGKEAIQQYLPDSLHCPTTSTPKGGQHLYFTCPNTELGNNARAIPGCDLRANGGYVVAPPSCNGNGKCYKWTVKVRDVEAIPDLPVLYINVLKEKSIYIQQKSATKATTNGLSATDCHKEMFTLGRRDNDLFHVSNCLTKGGMSDIEQAQVLERLILSWGEAPDRKWIDDKILSAMKRVERRQRNIAEEVRDLISATRGHIKTTEVYKMTQIATKNDMKAVRQELYRLEDQGIIAPDGKDGWKIVVAEAEPMEWQNAKADYLDVQFPFEIENLVKIMPKNLIVVAGSPNSGKTAFLLNMVRMNQDRFNVSYFSSEMGPMELQSRLINFDCPIDSWKFHAYERSSDFNEVIDPDGLNVIDYLELHTELYLIGEHLKKIFDRLKKGIAIIAIQKKPGSPAGYGGVFSLEKPRLYLTMEGNRIIIVKAKNWANKFENPNNKYRDFWLVDGCKFDPKTDWEVLSG